VRELWVYDGLMGTQLELRYLRPYEGKDMMDIAHPRPATHASATL